jgi:PAS domain-containing protein
MLYDAGRPGRRPAQHYNRLADCRKDSGVAFAANGNELLSRYYESKGQYQEALDAFKCFATHRDAILMTETSSHVDELQTRYETEKKNREVEYYRAKMHEIQSVLSNIAGAVRQSANIDILYEMIKSSLSRLIDTTNFYIGLYDKHTDMVTLPILIDNEDDIRSFPARRTLTSLVIKNRKSLLVDAKAIEQLIMDGEIELIGSPSKIWLGVPLILEDEVIGVIVVQSYETRTPIRRRPRAAGVCELSGGTSIERKHREQELDFQARAWTTSRIQVIATDLQGHITYVNKAVTAMLGIRRRKYSARRFIYWETTQKDSRSRPSSSKPGRTATWSGQGGQCDQRWRAQVPGEPHLAHLRRKRPAQGQGMWVCLQTSASASAPRKSACDWPPPSSKAAEAVIITDRDGCIEYVNPAFERTSGYSLIEVAGKKPSLLKSGNRTARSPHHVEDHPLRQNLARPAGEQAQDGALYDEESTITPSAMIRRLLQTMWPCSAT